MRRLTTRLTALAVAATGGLLLASCGAATPAVDLDAAREWVEGVQADESDGPGAAGTATLLVDPTVVDDDGEDDPAGSVRLEFPADATLTRADASCYGGGTVEVAVTVFATTGDATESDSFGAEIACDEDVHEIDLDGRVGSSALIEARSETATYAYVRLMQELTISNE
ncbi:hypothetical protein [Microbacterium sp. T2.11-28]|uniref:hypothetical protein n=1 Tax=Microbacterium sp. T2.11-28 TaxID=3041169 RepID=UPI0024779AD9|nr:hypothetical protein [Microbacterium sp. T2.11-28]CAI9392696.1 hypothetical protein MICABA_02196 [Microbacterium sp. T2.11-28]